jgi:hypothetical protein
MENNKEIFSRLKFIGKIQIGEKINLKYLLLQEDGLITQLTRTLFQDNRNKTLIFLNDTINKSFELIKCYEKSKKVSEKILCTNLITDLRNSKNGLHNLKETYASDLKFICDIDCLLQLIDAKLLELNVLFPPPLPPPLNNEYEEESLEKENESSS